MIKKLLTVVVGTIIAAYGLDLAIYAGFGSATLAVLWDGLSKSLGITMGQASFGVAILMIIFCLFYNRRQISWGTLIYQVVYSSFVDIFKPAVFYSNSRALNFFLMILGVFIFASGAAIYSYADFGRGSYEALTFAFVERNGFKTRNVRIALDVTAVALGMLFGGKAGLCTAATILLSGVTLQFVLEKLRKYDPLKMLTGE